MNDRKASKSVLEQLMEDAPRGDTFVENPGQRALELPEKQVPGLEVVVQPHWFIPADSKTVRT